MNLLDEYSIALLLALIGMLLVVAEVFFPSGGVLGFFAAVLMIGSVYMAYTKGGFASGLYFAAAETVLVPVMIFLAFQMLPYTPMGKILLGSAPTAEEVETDDIRQALVGRVGTALTKLLPAGAVEIEGQVIDCVSQSQAIEPGEYVRVVEVSANRVVVRRAEQGDRPTSTSPEDMLARPAKELGLEDLDLGEPGEDSQEA